MIDLPLIEDHPVCPYRGLMKGTVRSKHPELLEGGTLKVSVGRGVRT